MYLRKFLMWSMLFVAIMAYKQSNASELAQTVNDGFVPSHYAYLSLMKDVHHAVENDDRDTAIETIEEHMSLRGRDSSAFLNYLTTSYEGWLNTNRSLTDRVLCNNPSIASADQLFELMDSMDDIKEDNLKKYHRHVFASLNNPQNGELQSWIDTLKTSSHYYRFDHKSLYKRMGLDSDTVLAVACNRLASYYR